MAYLKDSFHQSDCLIIAHNSQRRTDQIMATLLKTIGAAFASRELCNSDDCIAPGAGADESYTAPLFDIAVGKKMLSLAESSLKTTLYDEARVLLTYTECQ